LATARCAIDIREGFAASTGITMNTEDLKLIAAVIILVAFYALLIRYGAQLFPRIAKGRVRCRDGWISESVGRGTCSWHGGIA
jgi:hypothetical protein